MGKESAIQWTDATWNIARGCSKVDEDCKYCYMYRDSLNGTRYEPKEVVRTKTVFNLPLKLKEPSKIFTSSLTDWGHPSIDSYRSEVWDIIRKCPHHKFQMLTKRPERLPEILPKDWNIGWRQVWLGTSIGSQDSIQRMIDLVTRCESYTKFLSLEPLHGPIDLEKPTWHSNKLNADFYVLPGIDWVIVGGESGNENGQYKYRECKIEWIESIIDQCNKNRIPVFVKQLGTHLAKQLKLKHRHGGDIEEWPEQLRVRQFPV